MKNTSNIVCPKRDIIKTLFDFYGLELISKEYRVHIFYDGEYYDVINVTITKDHPKNRLKNVALQHYLCYTNNYDDSFIESSSKISISSEAVLNYFKYRPIGFEINPQIKERIENKYHILTNVDDGTKRLPQLFYDDLHNGDSDNLLYLCYSGISYGFLSCYLDKKYLKTRFKKQKGA